MVSLATYGMTGIGIATAIGFVFALTVLNNNNAVIDGGLDDNQALERQADSPQPDQASNLEKNLPGPEVPARVDGGEAGSQETGSGAQAPAENDEGNLMLQQEQPRITAELTLVSLIALDANTREVIGEVAPETQFALGRPVLLQANFQNTNDSAKYAQFLALAVRNESNSVTSDSSAEALQAYEAANFQGDIAQGENVSLELYWNPGSTGEFTLMVFSGPADELTSRVQISPVASVPILVIQE